MHAQGVVRAVLVCGALPAFQLPWERALKGACSLLKVNLARRRRLIHVLEEHFTGMPSAAVDQLELLIPYITAG